MRLQRCEERFIPSNVTAGIEESDDVIVLSSVKDVQEFENNLEERMFRKKLVRSIDLYILKNKQLILFEI